MDHPPSPAPPSTHQTTVVGGVRLPLYHTETRPSSRRMKPDEVSLFENNPPKMAGRRFAPVNGEELWEVVDVTFSVKGWNSVNVQVEGEEEHHKIVMDDFIGMLKNGWLHLVEDS